MGSAVGAIFGALVGSVVTIAFQRSAQRRVERLAVAARVYEALTLHARNTTVARAGADDRDLAALVLLQPWYRRRQVARCVQAYQAARDQDTHQDALGSVLVRNPQATDRAIQALLPHTAHR